VESGKRVNKEKKRRRREREERYESESSKESKYSRRRWKSGAEESSSSESSGASSIDEKIPRKVKRSEIHQADSTKRTKLRNKERNKERWHEKEKEGSRHSSETVSVRKARSVMADYDEQKEGRGEVEMGLATDISKVLKLLVEERQKTENRLRDVEAESQRLKLEQIASAQKASSMKSSEAHMEAAKINIEIINNVAVSSKEEEKMQLVSDLEATRQQREEMSHMIELLKNAQTDMESKSKLFQDEIAKLRVAARDEGESKEFLRQTRNSNMEEEKDLFAKDDIDVSEYAFNENTLMERDKVSVFGETNFRMDNKDGEGVCIESKTSDFFHNSTNEIQKATKQKRDKVSVYRESNFQFDKAGDGVCIESNKSDFFHKITDEIQTVTKEKRAVIVFFLDNLCLYEFTSSAFYEKLSPEKKKLLTEDMSAADKEFVINKAATSGQITLCSAVFGRSTNFFCTDETVQKSGGVHIVQTFLSADRKEEIQIQGRTARQGQKGSYQMVLLESDLEKNFGLREKETVARCDRYEWLCNARDTYYHTLMERDKVSGYRKLNFQFDKSGEVGCIESNTSDFFHKITDEIQTATKQKRDKASVYRETNFQFDKGGDGVCIESNTSNFFRKITDEIQTVTKENRAVIILFRDDTCMYEFTSSANFRKLSPEKKKLLTEDMSAADKEFVINKAATAGQITVCSAVFARSTNFLWTDETAQKSGGVHIIQTFLSADRNEDIQIQERAARQGKKGSYQMVLLESDLEKHIGLREKERVGRCDRYEWLCNVRDTYRHTSMERDNVSGYRESNFQEGVCIESNTSDFSQKSANDFSYQSTSDISQKSTEEIQTAAKQKLDKFNAHREANSQFDQAREGVGIESNTCDFSHKSAEENQTATKQKRDKFSVHRSQSERTSNFSHKRTGDFSNKSTSDFSQKSTEEIQTAAKQKLDKFNVHREANSQFDQAREGVGIESNTNDFSHKSAKENQTATKQKRDKFSVHRSQSERTSNFSRKRTGDFSNKSTSDFSNKSTSDFSNKSTSDFSRKSTEENQTAMKQKRDKSSGYGESNFQFDKAGDGVCIESNKSDFFHKIAIEIQKATKEQRAVIIFFRDDTCMNEFTSSAFYEKLSRKRKLLLTEDMSAADKEFVINKAATAGQITVCSAVFARSTDFFCTDERVQKSGGVHIIQTFLSADRNEEIQIQGRTARHGKKGSYQMILLESDLEKKFGLRGKDKVAKCDRYEWLCNARDTYHHTSDFRESTFRYGGVESNKNAFFRKITDEIQTATKQKRAVIVFFRDISCMNEFTSSVFYQKLSRKQKLLLTEDMNAADKEFVINKAATAGQITVCSAVFGRSTDFLYTGERAQHSGGVHIIQTDHRKAHSFFKEIYLSRKKRTIDLDLSFVIDMTGSMAPFAGAIAGMIKGLLVEGSNSVVGNLKSLFPKLKFRLNVAVMGFRDIDDTNDQFLENTWQGKSHFTHNIQDAIHFIDSIAESSSGGGDLAEDQLGAINRCANWNNPGDWASGVKLMVLLTDAPAHGLVPPASAGVANADSYSRRHPLGLTASKVINNLISEEIDLFICSFNPAATSRTEKELSKLYLEHPDNTEEREVTVIPMVSKQPHQRGADELIGGYAKHIIFILDESASMSNHWAGVVAAYNRFLSRRRQNQNESDLVSVVQFATSARVTVKQKLISLAPKNLKFISGGTSFYPAANHACQLARETPPSHVPFIVFMSDGGQARDATAAAVEFSKLNIEIRHLLGNDLELHVIAFGSGVDKAQMKKIARVSRNAKVYSSADTTELSNIFVEIASGQGVQAAGLLEAEIGKRISEAVASVVMDAI
jgi:preprotein translocase subunit SecA/uncharacterized protein YegL